MKAKRTKLTAATLSAFLACGSIAVANTGGKTGTSLSNTSSSKTRKHRRHHKGGKKSKKGSTSTTPPPK